MGERQITTARHGHILTNVSVWSPDGQWIVYDTRSDPAGAEFDGKTIEMVHSSTGEVRELYRSENDACCGVASFHPRLPRVAFIHGPEHPTSDWQYGSTHRRGVYVDADEPGVCRNIDARDIVPPFTPGALRGGTHVHVFSADGEWLSFTYEDHVLAEAERMASSAGDKNQRNVGVSVWGIPTRARDSHPRNHDGECFSVVVTRTVNAPTPGSDEISRAYEDAWIGSAGYQRRDGSRQNRALAFLGDVVGAKGQALTELFVVDLPEDVTRAGASPLEGTRTKRPAPPAGAVQRRLTFTEGRKHPGLQGPRHWPRSSPNGASITLLMKDDQGIVQIWTASPLGGDPVQLTSGEYSVASAFTWSPDGKHIAYVADRSVWVVNVNSHTSTRLTPRASRQSAPRPEACVFSPDGSRIAYVRPVLTDDGVHNQIFVTTSPGTEFIKAESP